MIDVTARKVGVKWQQKSTDVVVTPPSPLGSYASVIGEWQQDKDNSLEATGQVCLRYL